MVGFTRVNDKLPQRLHEELLKAGPPEGKPIPEEKFGKAMNEYYAFPVLDGQGGPTLEKLRELEIEEKFIETYKRSLNI